MRNIHNPMVAVGVLTALLHAAKTYKPKPPTAEQIAAADKRTERQRWNDAIDAAKAAKKGRTA